MVRTLNVSAEIPLSREVRIILPEDVPTGPAELLVVVSCGDGRAQTLRDLLNSEFFGMWRDREDIQDSVEFAANLRREAWRR
jgi:hypothetical protein